MALYERMVRNILQFSLPGHHHHEQQLPLLYHDASDRTIETDAELEEGVGASDDDNDDDILDDRHEVDLDWRSERRNVSVAT